MSPFHPEQAFWIAIGKNILRRRRVVEMSQQALGDAIGVSFQQIQKYECGHTRANFLQLLKICEVLNISLGHLLGGTGWSLDSRSQRPQFILTKEP